MKCEKLARMAIAMHERDTDALHPQRLYAPRVRMLQEENGAAVNIPLAVRIPGSSYEVSVPLVLKVDADTSVTKTGTRRVLIRATLPYYRVTETPATTEGGSPTRKVVNTGATVSVHLVYTLPKQMAGDINGLTEADTSSATRDVSSDAVRAQLSLLRRLAAVLSNVDGRRYQVVDDVLTGVGTGFSPNLDPVTGQSAIDRLVPDADNLPLVPTAETSLYFGANPHQGMDPSEDDLVQSQGISARYNGDSNPWPLDRDHDALLRGIQGRAPLGDGICAISLAPTSYDASRNIAN